MYRGSHFGASLIYHLYIGSGGVGADLAQLCICNTIESCASIVDGLMSTDLEGLDRALVGGCGDNLVLETLTENWRSLDPGSKTTFSKYIQHSKPFFEDTKGGKSYNSLHHRVFEKEVVDRPSQVPGDECMYLDLLSDGVLRNWELVCPSDDSSECSNLGHYLSHSLELMAGVTVSSGHDTAIAKIHESSRISSRFPSRHSHKSACSLLEAVDEMWGHSQQLHAFLHLYNGVSTAELIELVESVGITVREKDHLLSVTYPGHFSAWHDEVRETLIKRVKHPELVRLLDHLPLANLVILLHDDPGLEYMKSANCEERKIFFASHSPTIEFAENVFQGFPCESASLMDTSALVLPTVESLARVFAPLAGSCRAGHFNACKKLLIRANMNVVSQVSMLVSKEYFDETVLVNVFRQEGEKYDVSLVDLAIAAKHEFPNTMEVYSALFPPIDVHHRPLKQFFSYIKFISNEKLKERVIDDINSATSGFDEPPPNEESSDHDLDSTIQAMEKDFRDLTGHELFDPNLVPDNDDESDPAAFIGKIEAGLASSVEGAAAVETRPEDGTSAGFPLDFMKSTDNRVPYRTGRSSGIFPPEIGDGPMQDDPLLQSSTRRPLPEEVMNFLEFLNPDRIIEYGHLSNCEDRLVFLVAYGPSIEFARNSLGCGEEMDDSAIVSRAIELLTPELVGLARPCGADPAGSFMACADIYDYANLNLICQAIILANPSVFTSRVWLSAFTAELRDYGLIDETVLSRLIAGEHGTALGTYNLLLDVRLHFPKIAPMIEVIRQRGGDPEGEKVSFSENEASYIGEPPNDDGSGWEEIEFTLPVPIDEKKTPEDKVVETGAKKTPHVKGPLHESKVYQKRRKILEKLSQDELYAILDGVHAPEDNYLLDKIWLIDWIAHHDIRIKRNPTRFGSHDWVQFDQPMLEARQFVKQRATGEQLEILFNRLPNHDEIVSHDETAIRNFLSGVVYLSKHFSDVFHLANGGERLDAFVPTHNIIRGSASRRPIKSSRRSVAKPTLKTGKPKKVDEVDELVRGIEAIDVKNAMWVSDGGNPPVYSSDGLDGISDDMGSAIDIERAMNVVGSDYSGYLFDGTTFAKRAGTEDIIEAPLPPTVHQQDAPDAAVDMGSDEEGQSHGVGSVEMTESPTDHLSVVMTDDALVQEAPAAVEMGEDDSDRTGSDELK
jgi:hypothetical protein